MTLLLAHAAATWALVGLIWTIQRVQYPGFAEVGRARFAAFHAHHTRRITQVVAPLMACEALTGLALLWAPPPGLTGSFLWIGVGLIALNWISTGFQFVPLHGRLRFENRSDLERLVRLNWLRTLTWSLRGLWALAALQRIVTS